MEKPNILLTYTETGMGHVTSMQSIADKLKSEYGEKLNLIESYIMQENKYSHNYEKFMIKQVKNTNVFYGLGGLIFFLLEVLGRRSFFRFLHRTLIKRPTDATINTIKKYNPDVIVSTHHLITYCAIEYKRKYNSNVKIITYNPDNITHVWWDNRDGLFIVNNDDAYLSAIKRRFKKENLYTVPFSIRKMLIEAHRDKAEYRKAHSLPDNNFTVIVADGAYAMAQAKQFTLKLIKINKPLTILFIAGKNEKMLDYMTKVKDRLKTENPMITLNIYPFMPNIHDLYCASDIFITKGGPNAILDSLYMGTPVIVNYYSQPMEKAAYKLFCKKLNCGRGVFDSNKIKKVIEEYIDNPLLLDQYRENTRKISGNTNGAARVADIIYSQTEKE